MNYIALAMATALMATSAQADPIEGIWRTHISINKNSMGHLVVEFSPCGEKICAEILYSVDSHDKKYPNYPHVGKKIIWDMVPVGNGRYENGKVFDPRSGKTYDSRMVLKRNKVKIKACVSFICNSLNWVRLK